MSKFDRPYVQTNPRKRKQKLFRLPQRRKVEEGFTTLELLVVLLMLGIVAAIAIPAWLAFYNTQKLNAAQSQVMEVMRQAQSTARRQKIAYQASFRQQGDRVQWATYPSSANPATQTWSNLEQGIKLDAETTLAQQNNVYRVQFNHNGEVHGQLGRVTLSLASGGNTKRCVIVSTLLGMIRTGENRPQRQGNPCD